MQVRKGEQPGAVPANLPELAKGDARDIAGKAFGVSGKSVDHAKKARHLTPSQASMCAARAREIYERQGLENMKAGAAAKGKENLPYPQGQARDIAGKAFGVSGKSPPESDDPNVNYPSQNIDHNLLA